MAFRHPQAASGVGVSAENSRQAACPGDEALHVRPSDGRGVPGRVPKPPDRCHACRIPDARLQPGQAAPTSYRGRKAGERVAVAVDGHAIAVVFRALAWSERWTGGQAGGDWMGM